MADVHSLYPNIHIDGNVNKWIKNQFQYQNPLNVSSLSSLDGNPFSSGDDTRHVRNGKRNKLKKNAELRNNISHYVTPLSSGKCVVTLQATLNATHTRDIEKNVIWFYESRTITLVESQYVASFMACTTQLFPPLSSSYCRWEIQLDSTKRKKTFNFPSSLTQLPLPIERASSRLSNVSVVSRAQSIALPNSLQEFAVDSVSDLSIVRWPAFPVLLWREFFH